MSQHENSGQDSGIKLGLEEVIAKSCEGYEHIAGVYIDHPKPSTELPTFLHITVYTGDAESYDEHIDLFNPETQVVVETEDGEQRHLSFDATATFDGPMVWNHPEGTPVYIADDVGGAEPITLEEGIEQVKKKLTDPDYRVPTDFGN